MALTTYYHFPPTIVHILGGQPIGMHAKRAIGNGR